MHASLQRLLALTPAAAHGPELTSAMRPGDAVADHAVGAINCHVHLPPNFSAFHSVTDALDTAASEQIRLLGASNYYDYTIYAGFIDAALDHGIYPLLGMEIIALVPELQQRGIRVNDPANPGKMYLCGKAITGALSMTPQALALLWKIRDTDAARMEAVAARITQVAGARGVDLTLTAADVIDDIVTRTGCQRGAVVLQERHVCQAAQERLWRQTPQDERVQALSRLLQTPVDGSAADAVTAQGLIRSHLLKSGKPAYVPETFVGLEHALELIRLVGGIACYPVLGDGATPIGQFEQTPDDLIAQLRRLGIAAAEFIPLRNAPEFLSQYVPAMHEAGMIVTAGTEHNTTDRIGLTPLSRGGAAIPAAVQRIFDHGACVLAGLQQARLSGQAPAILDVAAQKALAAEGRRAIDAARSRRRA